MTIQHKRIFSGLMAIVMIFAMLCVPAFAEDTTINGTYKESDIKVKVPDSGQAVINPLRLPVQLRDDLEATTGDAYGTITGAQIVTKPMYIINESEVDLKVLANGTITARGMRLAEEAFDPATNEDKSAFVYLQLALTDLDKNDATQGDLDYAKFCKVFADWEEDPYVASKHNGLVMGPRALEQAVEMLILKASDENGDWQKGSIGMFRLAGVVSENPRAAWNKDTDGFTANITFTFKPDMTTASISADDEKIDINSTASTVLKPHLSIGDTEIVSVEWDDSALPYGVELEATEGELNANLKVVSGAAETTGAVEVKAVITAKNGLTYEASFKGVEVVGDVKMTIDATPSDVIVSGNIVIEGTPGQLTVKHSSGGNDKSQQIATVKWTWDNKPDGVSITGDTTATVTITVTGAQVSIKPQKITLTAEVMDKNGAVHTITQTVTVIGTKTN